MPYKVLPEQNMIPNPKRGGGFRSGNSFSRIAPHSPGSVSGVKVSVVLGHHRTIVSAAFAQSFAPSVQL